MEKFQAHQGDVFLERVDSLPENLKDVTPKKGRIVLAYGEVTGHAHAIYEVHGRIPAKIWDSGAEKFLQVLKNCKLEHEEHAPIHLSEGIYRIPNFDGGTQREYSAQEIRRVMD